MATFSVVDTHHATLGIATVDIVNLVGPMSGNADIRVINRGATDIYFRIPLDAVTPTAPDPIVGSDECFIVPAGQTQDFNLPYAIQQIKLIATAGVAYSVEVI